MNLTDIELLIKKIGIGIIVTVIPFLILFAGLRLVQHVLSDHSKEATIQSNK